MQLPGSVTTLTVLSRRWWGDQARWELVVCSAPAMPGTRLIEIMNRLEAATSRLEDMTQSTMDSVVTLNGMPSDPATPKGLSIAAGRDVSAPPPLRPAASLPASIKAFDDLINNDVAKFVKLGEVLGGVVAEQVRFLDGANREKDRPNRPEADFPPVGIVGRSSSSVRCAAQNHRHRQSSQEARRAIAPLHGDPHRASTTDGKRW